MECNVMLCYVMLCNAMQCNVMYVCTYVFMYRCMCLRVENRTSVLHVFIMGWGGVGWGGVG